VSTVFFLSKKISGTKITGLLTGSDQEALIIGGGL
jgi:hypothetical protein